MKTQRSPKPNSQFTKYISNGLSWILAIFGIVIIGLLARQFAGDILVVFLILLIIAAVFISFLMFFSKTKIEKRHKMRLSDALEEGTAKCAPLPSAAGDYDNQWEEAYLRALASQTLQNDLNNTSIRNLPILNNIGLPARDFAIDRSLAVLLMSNSSSDNTLYSICKNACTTVSLNLIRGNEGCASDDLFSRSVRNIYKAAVILVNIDEKDPILYYQLGIAHALGKNVICISSRTKNITFDILQNRTMYYKDEFELAQLLPIALKQYREYLIQEQLETTQSVRILPDESGLWKLGNIYSLENDYRKAAEAITKISVRPLKTSAKPLTYVLSKKSPSNYVRRTVSAALNHVGEKVTMKHNVDG